jgi:large-conductance mechanosensitive channel
MRTEDYDLTLEEVQELSSRAAVADLCCYIIVGSAAGKVMTSMP